MDERFPENATTYEEAQSYLENRAKQFLRFGYILDKIEEHNEGKIAYFTDDNSLVDEKFVSIYVYKDQRGQDSYAKLKEEHCPGNPIITTNRCDIEEYLDYKDYLYKTVNLPNMVTFKEYYMIENYYGDQKSERSGVFYMNHIDEGLAILTWINADELAKKAYCLHPIFQGNQDLLVNQDMAREVVPEVLLLVMEYRNIANKYLSKRKISDPREIELSSIPEVNQMLMADKIQNFKDFELHHKGIHERSDELEDYFVNWLDRLGVSPDTYEVYREKLTF